MSHLLVRALEVFVLVIGISLVVGLFVGACLDLKER